MGSAVLIYAGSGLVGLWGLAHIAPVRRVVAVFEPLSLENRRILVMSWVGEGLALVFIGVLGAMMAGSAAAGDDTARLVCRACAGMLIVLALWGRATGGRTTLLPLRVCPLVKTAAAALMWIGVSL
jgi:hypothetical protein